MEYSQCWLAYRDKKTLIPRQVKRIFTDFGNEAKNIEKEITENAVAELKTAIFGFYQVTPMEVFSKESLNDGGICLKLDKKIGEGCDLSAEGMTITVAAADATSLLYGVFALIRAFAKGSKLCTLQMKIKGAQPLRMLNHWDNMDGSIERGYSGKSFFFVQNEIVLNERTRDYARLNASVGINAVVINNVNVKDAATYLITPRYLPKLKEMAHIYESYGIKLYLSLNFAAPMEIGKLSLSDPLDENVIRWWTKQMELVYKEIPTLGGFLIKADSEGRPGPFTYGRTHADGANMLAKAVKPYGGRIIWRCFVYNCKQNWRDRLTDRACAGYDNFKHLDGEFDENVILQIKNGPMDFQIREPVSPLFGAMPQTNQMLEVQAAQEYTGQQRHVCYLVPMWKEVLDFHTYCTPENDTVRDIVSGKTYGNYNCGMAAVANTGNDSNWTGHDLAALNWYGFGRLSFEPSLTAEEIAKEWITLTFGNDSEVNETILKIVLHSRETYEKYTSPLGIGWMVNPSHHYGPNVDGYEYDRWGTYHRADSKGIGVERSASGTGYTKQYFEPNASMYADIKTCPEELLLFFHYIPYDYVLSNGTTLLQHIYDTHFEGAAQAQTMCGMWKQLETRIEDEVYLRVFARMKEQMEHAKEWRDVINTYFFRKTGITDAHGRKIYD